MAEGFTSRILRSVSQYCNGETMIYQVYIIHISHMRDSDVYELF